MAKFYIIMLKRAFVRVKQSTNCRFIITMCLKLSLVSNIDVSTKPSIDDESHEQSCSTTGKSLNYLISYYIL